MKAHPVILNIPIDNVMKEHLITLYSEFGQAVDLIEGIKLMNIHSDIHSSYGSSKAYFF